jgi:hypothetical protein
VLRVFDGSKVNDRARFKLFNDEKLRAVVFRRLGLQLAKCGACRPDPTVRLCLAAGKVFERDRDWLHQHFKTHEWELWDEPWLRAHLKLMSEQKYEDQVSAVVTKLLLRGKVD